MLTEDQDAGNWRHRHPETQGAHCRLMREIAGVTHKDRVTNHSTLWSRMVHQHIRAIQKQVTAMHCKCFKRNQDYTREGRGMAEAAASWEESLEAWLIFTRAGGRHGSSTK